MKRFFIGDGNVKAGPFSVDDLKDLLLKNRIGLTEQVYDQKERRWYDLSTVLNTDTVEKNDDEISILTGKSPNPSLPDTAVGLKEFEQKKTPVGLVGSNENGAGGSSSGNPDVISENSFSQPTARTPMNGVETWFLKDKVTVLGPYKYVAMLAMILEGTIRETDLIRRQNEPWRAAKDVPEFSVEVLKGLTVDSAAKIAARGGFKRNNARVDVQENVIVQHNGFTQSVYMTDISVGGCALLPDKPLFKAGDEVYLAIFREGETAESENLKFNAKGIVLAVAEKREKYFEHYKHAIRFTSVTKELMQKIRERILPSDGT